MQENRTIILTHSELERKLIRMAWEIYENNYTASKIILIGIAENGKFIAGAIEQTLKKISGIEVYSGSVNFDKKLGFDAKVNLEISSEIKGETVVIVDDVLNSGRTMLAAMLPILALKPAKVQIAVLANRNHKKFPVHADIVGISLATTLQEHIWFEKDSANQMQVYLT